MIVAPFLALAVAAQAPPARPPIPGCPNLSCYFGTDDYPTAALDAGTEGTVRFRLQISAEGRVSECSIIGSSGSADLDGATCQVLGARARYSPARDAAGRPTAGTDEGTVAWRLPRPSTIPAQNCAGCTPPRANPVSYFRHRDYPRAALRAREEGQVAFRLLIGTDGRVNRCEVIVSSGSQALDYTTCAILFVRARYSPARDPNGARVEGVDNGTVTWRLPG